MKSRLGLPGDRAGRVLAGLLVSAFLVLPFLYSRHGIDVDLGPKSLGLAVLVAVLAARRLRRPPGPAFSLPHPVILIAFAFVAWSVAATAMALNVPEAAYETAKTFLIAVLFVEAADIMASAGPARARAMTARAAVAFTLAASAIGWAEAALRLQRGYSLENLYRISGTFGHKNLFSSLLAYGLPFALFGLARFRGIWRAAAGAAFVLGGGLVILLQTRSVWLGAAAAFAVCAGAWALCARPGFASLARGQGRPGKAIAFAAAILMLAAAFGAAWIPAFGMRQRIAAAVDPEKNHWRLLLWRKSADLALENPIFGAGPGNWKIAIPKRQLEVVQRAGGEKPGEETGMVRPHNDYLWVLCETGFPGLILYIAGYAAILIACWRKMRGRPGSETADYALCLLGTIVIYAVDAAFSFPRERVGHGAVMAILIAGLVASGPDPGFPAIRRAWGPARAVKWLYILVSCVLAAGAWMRWKAEREVRTALDARAAERWDQVVSRLEPWVACAYPLDGFGNPSMFYAGTAYTLLGDLDRATAAFEKAAEAHPYHAHTLNDLGTCMSMKREPRRAIGYFERAVAVRPGLAEAWLNGAIVYYGMSDRENARRWLSHVPDASRDPRREKLERMLENEP